MAAPASVLTARPTPPGASVDGRSRGVVAVHHLGPCHATAGCSCGWAGRRRLLKAAAEQDAWAHSAAAGCDVASPFVLAW